MLIDKVISNNWTGRGNPARLRGEETPVEAQLVISSCVQPKASANRCAPIVKGPNNTLRIAYLAAGLASRRNYLYVDYRK